MAGEAQKGATSEEINRLILKHAKPGVKFTLEDVRGHRAVAVGLPPRIGVVVDGEAGEFLAAFNAGAMVVAKASVGDYVAYGQTAGAVQVVGRAGEGAGALLYGGSLHIFGEAGAGAGWRMAGGQVVVKDDAGELAGAGMAGGELAVLGRAQGALGVGMAGGSIFARAGSAVDASSCRASALEGAGAQRLRELAAAVKVVELDPAQYVRVTPLALARPVAPSGPGALGARVTVAQPAGPRVKVSLSDDDPGEAKAR